MAHFPGGGRNPLIPSGYRVASGSATSIPSGSAPWTPVESQAESGPGAAPPPAGARPPGPPLATARRCRLRAPALGAPWRGPAGPGGALSAGSRPEAAPSAPSAPARRAREGCRRSGRRGGGGGRESGGAARAEVRERGLEVGAVAALRPRSEGAGRTVGGRRGSRRGAGAERAAAAAAPRNQVSSLRSPSGGRPHLRRLPPTPVPAAPAARAGM